MLKIIQFLCLFTSLTASAEIANFHKVNDWLYRGAAPGSSKDYEMLFKLGVKTVINLDEFTYQVDRDKSRWKKAVKITGHQGYFLEEPMGWVAPPAREDVLKILREMTDPDLVPVFIHCTKGEDRTGMMVGLYRIHAEHWPHAAAYAEMKKYGFKPWLVGLKHAFSEYSNWDKLSD